MIDTDFQKAVQGYQFERAVELSDKMNTEQVIEELISISYAFEPSLSLMPFAFINQVKASKNDLKWNYILMRVVDVCYLQFEGVANIQLCAAKRVLEIEPTNKRALQTIIHLYEREESNCTFEEYQKVKAQMAELGITMYD